MGGFGISTSDTNKRKISKNGPQLLEAAVRAHKTGDITSAEALYLNAINSGFHHEIAYSNLGVIYKNTGRKEKALAYTSSLPPKIQTSQMPSQILGIYTKISVISIRLLPPLSNHSSSNLITQMP